ncbi:MAG: TolC family protein, partial [Gemmatimonadales bacterium]
LVARLNALLGRSATVDVGAVELSADTPPLPPADSLIEVAAEVRPALRAARERVLAAEAGYRSAQREMFPDITITAGYGNRPQFENLATLMVGISVPIWAGSRQRPLQREMLAMQAMEEARATDVYNETYARLTELAAQATRARNLEELYRTAVLPQARAAVESALSAYRVGEVDYMTLVQNQMTVNRYEVETVRLRAEYHTAVAHVEALAGALPGDDR